MYGECGEKEEEWAWCCTDTTYTDCYMACGCASDPTTKMGSGLV